MQMKRTMGEKGQVVVPKDVRDHMGIKPGSDIVFEIRENEVVIRPQKSGREFLKDFLKVPKLKKPLTTKEIREILDEQYEEKHEGDRDRK